MELNVGDGLLFKAVAQTTGRSIERIKADAKELGDIGKVAEASKSSQRVMFQPAKLTVRGVFEKLKEIATMSGNAVRTWSVNALVSDRCLKLGTGRNRIMMQHFLTILFHELAVSNRSFECPGLPTLLCAHYCCYCLSGPEQEGGQD